MDPLLASYEEVPYESTPIHDAHPDVMATSAILLALDPPKVPTSRVLELGCATGGNLITLALSFPKASFVGIDLSPRQIALGQATLEKLQIKNVTLYPKSILDINADFGQFDYIICHGVYSWVPQNVQQKILSIFSKNLSENGLAYVSYNTYPGWHIRGMVREMLNYHVRNIPDPRQRIVDARAFMELMSKTVRDPDGPYGKLLGREAKMVREAPDSYLYHEHLEQDNRPMYFHEFARQCAEADLDFVAETRLSNHAPPMLSATIRDAITQLPSEPIEREQYLDFLQNRTFRRSLVSHKGVAQKISPSPDRITQLHVECNVRPIQNENAKGDVQQFATREGQTIATNNPHIKSVLNTLFEVWPRALPFNELSPEEDRTVLTATVMQCYLANLVEFHWNPPHFTMQPSQRPLAFPLARLQASQGLDRVSSLRHRTIILGEFDRLVLPLLDGRRNHDAIAEEVLKAMAAGTFTIQHQGKPVTDAAEIREVVNESLPIVLRRLAQAALLMA